MYIHIMYACLSACVRDCSKFAALNSLWGLWTLRDDDFNYVGDAARKQGCHVKLGVLARELKGSFTGVDIRQV